MEKEAILKLYEAFVDDIYTDTVEKIELSQKIIEQEKLLLSTLTQEQKEIFSRLNECENKKNELVNKNTFVFAYSLANKLMIESLEKDASDNK